MRRACLFAAALSCSPGLSARRPPHEVAAASPQAVAAEPQGAEVTLPKVGEVVEVRVDPNGEATARLPAPTGKERFVAIIASTRLEHAAAPFEYALTLDAPSPASPSTLVTSCALSRSAEPMAPAEAPSATPSGGAPAEAATRTLVIPGREGASTITARAVAVGTHAIVWADTTNPTTLDLSFAEQFRADFERLILTRAREVFGSEPDLDGDGRIHLVFSKLTREHGVAFFTGCDLLPSSAGCAGSNRGEYLYLTPPDAIDPPYNTPSAIKEILAHELSHLLHFNRKVLRNQLAAWPDGVYMTEGIGALAQDVVGFQAGNLYVTQAGLDGIDQFSLADVFQPQPRPQSPDGISRGASYLFARYVYDRGGGDAAEAEHVRDRGGPALLARLISAPVATVTALLQLPGAAPAEVALDFFTALAMSNREDVGGAPPSNACFAFQPTSADPVTRRQRGANMFAPYHGRRMTGPRTVQATAVDGRLLAGGVEYVELAPAPRATELALHVRIDPKAQPRLRLGRWQ